MPAGVAGTGPSSWRTSLPRLTGWRPSPSLSGSTAPRAALKSDWRGTGVWCLGAVPGDSDVMRQHADPLARLVLLAHVAGRGGVVADEDGAQPDGLAALAQ